MLSSKKDTDSVAFVTSEKEIQTRIAEAKLLVLNLKKIAMTLEQSLHEGSDFYAFCEQQEVCRIKIKEISVMLGKMFAGKTEEEWVTFQESIAQLAAGKEKPLYDFIKPKIWRKRLESDRHKGLKDYLTRVLPELIKIDEAFQNYLQGSESKKPEME